LLLIHKGNDMKKSELISTLAKHSTAQLQGFGSKLGLNLSGSKIELVKGLVDHASVIGLIDFMSRTGLTGTSPSLTDSKPSAKPGLDPDSRVDELGRDVIDAKCDIASLKASATSIATAMGLLSGETTARLNDLQRGIDALKIKAQSVDQTQVRAEISRVVSEALGPVLQAVKGTDQEDAIRTVAAAPTESRSFFDLTGVSVQNPRGEELETWIWNSPDAPPIDKHWVWQPEYLNALGMAADLSINVWLAGPKGTGKSSIAQQFAAITGRPFTRINFEKHSSAESFIGSVGLNNGSTQWEPGAFLQAYSTPGSVILLDELSVAHPGVLTVLNGLLEPGARVNLGGKTWTRAPGVVILAADNTAGSGDYTGRYSGTQALNSATVDRFSATVMVGWLPKHLEVAAIARRAFVTDALAEHIVDALNLARGKSDQGEIVDPPSIRRGIAFAQALRYMTPEQAWQCTIVAGQPAESEIALTALFATAIDCNLIKREI
jgi:cobaltochelatase CobS